MKKILLVLLLVSVSFSSLQWKTELGGPVITEPAVFNSKIIVGTEDKIYGLNWQNGAVIWQKDVDSSVVKINEWNGKLFAATSGGTVYVLKDFGVEENKFSIGSPIYGMETGTNLYVSAKNGIYIYKTNNFEKLYSTEKTLGTPKEYLNKIIITEDEKITAVSQSGEKLWSYNAGPFWNPKPEIFANTVFVGGMDHNFYAVDVNDGKEKWISNLEGAVSSGALISGGKIYVATNDGYIYSLDAGNGNSVWKGGGRGGFFTKPAEGTLGNNNVVLVGSSDGKAYAFNKLNGERIWGYQTTGSLQTPLIYQNRIYLSSYDGYVYSLSTERGCMIDSPEFGDQIGYTEVEVKGRAFSVYANPSVEIRFNEGIWERVELEAGEYSYLFDPNELAFGPVSIECRVVDSAGVEGVPNKIDVVRNADLPKPEFVLEYPKSVNKGETIEIEVENDLGETVKDFSYTIEGKTYKGSGSISLDAKSAGKVEITFSKTGYADKKISITVNEDITLYIVGGIVVLIVAATGAYFLIWKKKR
ncbi:PQQ-like beta-propeller repeat protein [Candidatus Micrarchaeota archaeon]|nr:PQQ-like beta-propeller repeat protein [Candidatus Micrarchaeota archaeon]